MICRRKPIVHELGSFVRTFCSEEFKEVGLVKPIAQINQTVTHAKWSVRGLHFQLPPSAETKLVTCLRGEVFDVAVDIRHNSPTFLRWHGEVLSAENNRSLFIPEGFAHGYQTLTTNCEMLYFHSAAYAPEAERGLHARDPSLAIEWPFPIEQMSDRDNGHPFIDQTFDGIRI